jgi:predicted phage tail protein
MFVTLHLGGFLGPKYGHLNNGAPLRFQVSRAVDAVKALAIQVPEFKRDVLDYQPGWHLIVGDECLGPDRLGMLASSEDVYLVPAIGGGDNPLVKILIGAAIIYFTAGGGTSIAAGWMTGAGLSAGFAAGAASIAFGIGVNLVLGGVSQLLYTAPKGAGPAESPENKPSYVFSGPVNAEAQGHPIPLLYGKLRVGSVVASAGIETVDIYSRSGSGGGGGTGDGGGGWDDWGSDGGGGWVDKNFGL